MSFDAPFLQTPRIAIIGAGISGLGSAYLAPTNANVTLFESEPCLGGHARTVLAGKTGDQPVDTGFIVFNFVNYPHLTRFFRDLDVPIERSDMSFGATIDDGRVEYSLSSLSALFGDKRNALRPAFLKMVRDILRFNAEGEHASGKHGETIDELLSRLNLGREFRNNYLIPMCGAIWSTPAHEIMGFPRHLSIHSGGFVLSGEPLVDLVPVEPARTTMPALVGAVAAPAV